MRTRTGSTIVITYDGADITRHVMFASASFEVQFSAIPGSFEFTCKDEKQELGFVTGKEVTLTVDDKQLFGGFLTQVSRKFAFPMDRTDRGVGNVKTRLWVLRGVDYNILFDKRVLRFSTADTDPGFLKQLPTFKSNRKAGEVLRNEVFPKYVDMSGFDYTSEVDDVDYTNPDATKLTKPQNWQLVQQGTLLRKQMEDFSTFNGAVWYIGGDKKVYYKALEKVKAPWGFSDVPNWNTTIGFRELDATEDGSNIINDALIWGGSEWAGKMGGTVFSRHQNDASIALHKRWQMAETHFGEQGYGIQAGVDARSELIVEGSKSQQGDQQYGYRYPLWQFRLAWFANDVPGGNHLTPGQITMIHLYTFGNDPAHPLIQNLPLRQVKISFPDLDHLGNGYIRFDGFFGIQASDPWTLWRYLLKLRDKEAKLQISSVTNQSDRASFGAFGSFSVKEFPNGSRTEFSIYITVDNVQTPIGYVEGTTSVYLNQLLQRNEVDYYESDPMNGVITFYSPPQSSDWVWIQCRTTAG